MLKNTLGALRKNPPNCNVAHILFEGVRRRPSRRRFYLRQSDRNFNSSTFDTGHVRFSPDHTEVSAKSFSDSFRLLTDFITLDEEDRLFKEVEIHLKRHPYEKDHWDEVILSILFFDGGQILTPKVNEDNLTT